ncbi:hypothetical protein MAC_08558 [Metarhizium acridum CQMa 102]|uniref:Uncharacterized protein n=1 Tax=Metarhizium acridum (strain CQMa 102) TaxID=655827 RepID=E9EFB0_METAQ|nr:uncharacterized protein MAC_08558 [Metarhizium acridum CQMa 102]EFY85426.1 hypothetical protein MAC_08558 [Metarhizium acridum CQMa 102]
METLVIVRPNASVLIVMQCFAAKLEQQLPSSWLAAGSGSKDTRDTGSAECILMGNCLLPMRSESRFNTAKRLQGGTVRDWLREAKHIDRDKSRRWRETGAVGQPVVRANPVQPVQPAHASLNTPLVTDVLTSE